MFDNMVAELESIEDAVTPCTVKVTKEQYKKWQKLYSFDALKGTQYGQSFCKHFNIMDFRLYFDRNWAHCDRLIRREWVV